MLSRILAALPMLLLIQAARAEEAPTAEILEYGLYTVDRIECETTVPVHFCSEANLRHAATMTRVPAEIGVTFGIHYKVHQPDASAPIILKVVFPSEGLKNPAMASPIFSDTRTSNCSDGSECDWDYTFEYPWELVWGPWHLQVWSGGTMLTQKTFQVAPEPESP